MNQTALFPEPEPAAGEPSPAPPRVKKAANADPPNLGKAIRLPIPDFSDPNRKPVCLEVDFPIANINGLAVPESTSPGVRRRPEYNAFKWFARRGQSVFRAMLIGASIKAPDDPRQAAKLIWESFYCNHQKAGHFKKLRVLDLFMGGGVTLVEGALLGFQVTGVDLNPIAWFVTKNEMACSDPEQVRAFFDDIETQVKPQIQPFYVTSCPRGHQGRWIDVESGQVVEVDPIDLPRAQRHRYRWEGPEIIYTFWAKHGPCKARFGEALCGHRTPIFKTPVIAEKKLIASFIEVTCEACGHTFDTELGETRMAPSSERVVLDNEPSFTEMSQEFALLLNDYSKGNAADKRERVLRLITLVDSEPGLSCPKCRRFAGQRIKAVNRRPKLTPDRRPILTP